MAGKGAGPAVVKLTIETPPVKPGAVLEARLELSLYGNAQKTPEAELKAQNLHLSPRSFRRANGLVKGSEARGV